MSITLRIRPASGVLRNARWLPILVTILVAAAVTLNAQDRTAAAAPDSVTIVTTKTGAVYTGRVTGRTADSLRMVTVDGGSVAIAVNRIRSEEMRPYNLPSGDSLAVVNTYAGSVIMGRISRRTADTLTIVTQDGMTIGLPSSSIRSIEMRPVSSMREGEYWFENPNSTRYLIGPSAFSLRAGEGYYLNTWVVLNSFAVGLTDNISIGGGFEILSLSMGNPAFFITPRVAFPVGENFGLSVGYVYANTANDDFAGVSLAYGIATVGNTDNNLSFGCGFGAIDGEWSGSPVITISGMLRASRRIGFVSENYIVIEDGASGIFSYGIRFIGETITVDVAFLNNADIMETFALGVPYVDMMVRF